MMKPTMNLLKPISRLFLLFILVLSSSTLSAQSIIIKVKKGTARIGSQSLTESSASASMKSSDVLNVLPSALVMARQDVIVIELPSNKEYSYATIQEMIKKKKRAYSGGFTTVAFKDPIQKTNPTPLKGSSTRGSGMEYKSDFYYPYDSMLIADTNPIFVIGNQDTKITSNVVLKNTTTNEVYYDAVPEANGFEIGHLPEGKYEWSYSIEYMTAIEKMTQPFKNTFTVPSDKDKKEIATKVKEFKKNLKGFSAEMQEVLLLEYCVENGIYHKLPLE